MDCNWARSSDYYNEKCGPRARYWQARTYPWWMWYTMPIAIGALLMLGYAAFWVGMAYVKTHA